MEDLKFLNSKFYAQTVEKVNQSFKYLMWHFYGPLAKICLAVWTIGLRGKVDGLEALQDHYEGPFANLLL